ncbi:MAG: sugar dehydrogenase complex small subunit [Pseudomonadota bacterium]
MRVFSKREFILATASSIAGLICSTPSVTASALLDGHNPVNSDPAAPSFEVFYRLSQLVTLRDDLDVAYSKDVFAAFQGEPWVEKHISTSYAMITALLEGQTEKTISPIFAEEFFEFGERWFVSHLLTTYYLGVYYHDERPNRRVTYDKALMFELLADYRPVPGFSDGAPGDWVKTPPIDPR